MGAEKWRGRKKKVDVYHGMRCELAAGHLRGLIRHYFSSSKLQETFRHILDFRAFNTTRKFWIYFCNFKMKYRYVLQSLSNFKWQIV